VPTFFLGIGVAGDHFSYTSVRYIKSRLQALNIEQIEGIATFDKKRNHPLMATLAREFNTVLLLFPATILEAQTARLLTPCEQLKARIGCHSVAEAAALAAAGETAHLVIAKTICHKITFAVAKNTLGCLAKSVKRFQD